MTFNRMPNKKPQVVYKPKSPIAKISAAKLSAEHAPHLQNLVGNGLMRKVLPDDVAQHFLQAGYARQAVGGLMATDAGHRALMMYNKDPSGR